MKLAPTKVLAKEINKRVSDMNVSVVYMTDTQTEYHVGFYHDSHVADYDWEKGKYKFFAISYPDHYYAGENYAGVNDLLRIARSVVGGLSLDSFCAAFQSAYEI